jgi:Protein of unknown function (DUF2924)
VIVMTAPVNELEDEIAHLRDLDLPGLRARWHSVFRRKAPGHLPRHLLYRMIAYRLQAERLGDAEVEVGLRAGDGRAEVGVAAADLDVRGVVPIDLDDGRSGGRVARRCGAASAR